MTVNQSFLIIRTKYLILICNFRCVSILNGDCCHHLPSQTTLLFIVYYFCHFFLFYIFYFFCQAPKYDTDTVVQSNNIMCKLISSASALGHRICFSHVRNYVRN